MANIGTLTARLGLDTKDLRAGTGRARGMFSGLEKGAVGSMGAITASIGKMAAAFGVVMVGAKLVGAFKNMITIGADFEYTMATVGGVMRATGNEMKSLTAIAKKMGETTEWTASQAGDALKFLGMAGFKAAEATKALPGVLDLATAGNLELGRAADIASNALTAMNLPVKQLTRINDVFIGTITRSNTNMEQMAESFKYAAPVARAYGYTVEELSGMIGALGDAGIQGSLSGTMLRRSMLEASKIAKEMGFESGKLVDVLQSLKDIGEEDTVIMERFGMRAAAGIGAMLTSIPKIREFQETLKGVGGEAARLANIMRTTVKGSFAELKSVVESVAIDTFDRLASSIEDTVQSIIAWIRRNKDEMVALFEVMTKSALAVATVITKLVGIFVDLTSTVRESADAVDGLSNSMADLKTQTEANADATERQAEAFAKVLFWINEVVLTGPRLMDKLAQATRKFGDALLGIATGGGPALVDEFTDTLERLEEWLSKVRTGFERATPEWQAWLEFEAFLKSLADESKGATEAINALAESQKAMALVSAQPSVEAMDKLIRMYAEMAAATNVTTTEMQQIWQSYAFARVKQIEAEAKALEEAFPAKVEAIRAWAEYQKQQLTEEFANFKTHNEKLSEIHKHTIDMRMVAEGEAAEYAIGAYESVRQEFEAAEEEKQQMVYELAQVWNQTMTSMVNGMVAQMQGAEVDMERIFKQMALAFMRLFIRQALGALAASFISPFLALLMMFDKVANDRMAMKQGERFVGFFSQGAQRAMARMDLAPAMAQMNLTPAIASAPVSELTASALSPVESDIPRRSDVQVTVNVNAPITSDQFVDWVVHDMAPIIERAAESGQTRITIEPFVQTGDSSGIIT